MNTVAFVLLLIAAVIFVIAALLPPPHMAYTVRLVSLGLALASVGFIFEFGAKAHTFTF